LIGTVKLVGLQASNIVAQCYHGAAAMSGVNNGAQQHVLDQRQRSYNTMNILNYF
jgi:hypothetical protein